MHHIILDTLALTILLLFYGHYFALQNTCSIILSVEPSELCFIGYYCSAYGPCMRCINITWKLSKDRRILDPN